MLTARLLPKIATVLAFSCLTAVLSVSEVRAAAGGIQNCTAGSTCTVGEFLYDDSSVAITSAICTVTSKYPNGTDFLVSQIMTGQSDGWYAYEFTAPLTTGLYRTTVSCTVSGDTLSIDKSFQVNTATATPPDTASIAQAVWGYSTRTVSTFGTLVSDVWSNTVRKLTGTGLDSGQLATQSDVTAVSDKVATISTTSTNVTNVTNNVTDIKNVTEETRLLLEQVVNKPVIQNVLEDTTPDISQKLQDTKAMANQLYVNNQFLTTQTAALASRWNSLTGKEALEAVFALSKVLGESADPSSANTMFGTANWIRDSWDWDESAKIYDQMIAVNKLISSLKENLADYQKTPLLYRSVKQLVKNSLVIESTIGTVSDLGVKNTLYSKIKNTQDLALSLDEKGDQIEKVLGGKTSVDVDDLQNQVLALNKVPGVSSALTSNTQKNLLLGLRGIINSNKKLLALGSGKTMVNVWLELGSIVFKTVATNPSTLVAQNVDIKYYLPKEIKQGDIMKTDAGLSVSYDSEKDQLYVLGTFRLTPGQTRTFSVETKDIWEMAPAEIQSIRDQANELFKPLEKTAYYAQGVSLKSDINASMDQVSVLIAGAVTPEEKIKAYRQAEILKNSANAKLAGMKDLVTQASAAVNLFGFVGGAQTIAVWGLIVVIAAGFVFMTIYMKTMIGKANVEPQKHNFRSGVHPVTLALVMIVSSAISAGATGYVVNSAVSKNYEEKIKVLGAQTEKQILPTPVPELGTGGQYLVVVSDTPTGFLRVRKTPSGVEIAQVAPGDKLLFLDEQDGWYKVRLEDEREGWISKQYSSKE